MISDIRKNSSLKAWTVCFIAGLFFFYEFFQMNMLNSISSQLMLKYSIDTLTMGMFSSAFFYGNAVFLIFAGIIVDRNSVRKIILSAMLLCTVASIILAMSNSLTLSALARLVTGICHSFALISCIKLIIAWLPRKRVALATGSIVTMGMLGGMVAQTPFVFLINKTSLTYALLLNSFIGLIFLGLIWLIVIDNPSYKDLPSLYRDKVNHKEGSLKGFFLVTKNPQNWKLGLFAGLINLPLTILGALWGNLFITRIYGINSLQASIAAVAIFLGVMIGSPLLGWISDMLNNRKAMMVVSSILLICSLVTILCLQSISYLSVLVIFWFIGFFSAIQVVSFCYTTEINPSHLTGTAMGFISMLIMLCTALMQPLIGWIIEKQASTITSSDLKSYQLTLLILIIAAFISLILSLLMKENRQTYTPKY